MQRVEEVAALVHPGTELAHGWMLYVVAPVQLEQADAVFREPAAAVPGTVAGRLDPLRIFAVSYLACGGGPEFVSTELPSGETHSSLWLSRDEGLCLFLSLADTTSHDAGFELLAAVADLLVPRLKEAEFQAYERLLERELREGVASEIDEEALEAKNASHAEYASVSLASTLAEYMHALWHDVEVRHGDEHLPERCLKRRLELLRRLFPPNPGYTLYR